MSGYRAPTTIWNNLAQKDVRASATRTPTIHKHAYAHNVAFYDASKA
jgi:hypothetical protein